MTNSELKINLKNIKDIYISSEGFWHITCQSCDCQKIIVDTGEKLFLFKYQKFEDAGCITFDEISDFDKKEFIYKVDLENEKYKYSEISYFDNGFVNAVKFVGENVYLFIFSSEYNLILTKSKDDMFDETYEVFEDEMEIILGISKCRKQGLLTQILKL